MEKLVLKSSLSQEQIKENFANVDFFDEVMAGVEDAVKHAKGHPTQETLERKRTFAAIEAAEKGKCMHGPFDNVASLMDALSDDLLLAEAEQRLADGNHSEYISQEEMMQELGLTDADLAGVDVEIE